MITVVNKYKHDPTDNDVYIGRGSIVGNPYTHLDSKYDGAITVKTRKEAIELYGDYMDKKINTSDEFKNYMNDILEEAKQHDVNLVCFCKPKSCHGDIIKKYLDNKIREDSEIIYNNE